MMNRREQRGVGRGAWGVKSTTTLLSLHVPRTTHHAGFTLIEIMVVVAILAIIMAISIPSIYTQMHKDSMRQAVADLSEACSHARARAILNGTTAEVRIRPRDRSINVVEGAARPASTAGSTFSFGDGGEINEHRASGAAIFSAKISDHIIIEFIGVNLIPDLQELDEVTCLFYPNGTSDELVVLIRSDKGEIRKITTEVVTGIADVEVIK